MIEAQRRRASLALLRLLDVGKRDTGTDLMAVEPRTVFVLSTGRAGTQYLARHLDSDPNVAALHEPSPSRGLRFWTVAYLEGAVDQSMMRTALRRYRTKFFEKISAPVYVESNNFLAGFAESLIAEFDEPTLIHVVRDPRTYVRSAINKGAASGLKGIVNSVVPFAHLDLERDSDDPTIQRSARYWTLVNEHLRGVGDRYSSYHLFKYEDLFDSTSGEFARLVDVVGAGEHALEARREVGKVNQSPRDLVPPWDEWSPAQHRVLIDECGEAMTRFGYVT